MLGQILSGLTNPATAEAVIAAVGRPELLERVRRLAADGGMPIGDLVASKVRPIVDRGGEDLWLDLLGAMSGSPNPGAAAIDRVLTWAFPDPVRVRVTRSR
jgi:hypothetical protein